MKRTVRMVAVSGVTLLLCMVMLVSSAFAGSPQKTLAEKFDYGSSLGANEEVSAKDLLEMILGKPVSEAEGAYLNTLSGVSFRYSSFVPESNISTVYDRERGELAVEVKPQRYTASNGLVVEWIPTQATIDGASLGLVANGEHYDCTFENVLHTGDFYMTVDFSWNVLFPDDAVEELLNLAYTAGDAALAEILAFETQLADYHAKMDAYEKYMVYVKEKQEYDDYMVLYRQYEKDLADYLAYCDAYEDYLAKKDLYEKWQAFWAYDEYRTNYLPALQKYTDYKNSIAAVETKLRIMENLFITDSNGWQLYGGLMGSLVAEVIKEENKDLLVKNHIMLTRNKNLWGIEQTILFQVKQIHLKDLNQLKVVRF